MRLSDNVKEQLAAEGKGSEEKKLRGNFQGRVPAIFFMEESEGDGKEMFVVRTNGEAEPPQREPICMLDVAGQIELNRSTQMLADLLGKPVFGIRFIAYDVASVAYPKIEAPEA